MTKIFSLSFVALLAWAHWIDPRGDAWSRPLSLFRDVDPAWIGYALFGLLLALGLAAARTAWRARSPGDALVYLLATVLLALVAATPSFDLDHLFCSLWLLVGMFLFFAVRLYASDAFLGMLMHLQVPTGLMFALGGGGYGAWQKGVILYLVAALVLHEEVLAAGLRRPRRRGAKRVWVVVGRRRTNPSHSAANCSPLRS
jgi:hypothetical protein